ncbi:MAG TPA: hypothetical protein VM846_10330 [Vicinamibacterales bacterium]|jgi:predicted membrane channel-forming protein YqfA (hemolysin III family)|nr:hypothetical protein [Vicinamibacterales bacterium]
MHSRNESRLGVIFTTALIVTWLATGLIAVMGWHDREVPGRLLQWIALWAFTVAAPTIQALRIHRLLDDFDRDFPTPSQGSLRQLEHARIVILICGSMTVLCVFTIVMDVWRATP